MKKYAYLFGLLMLWGANTAQAQLYDCQEEIFPRQDKATKLWGYKNFMGEWRVPATFVKAYSFEGKNAIVIQGKQYGILNCEGRLIATGYDEFASFVYGKGWGRIGDKWALVDDKGRQLIAPTYTQVKEISPRTGSLTWVEKQEKWGLISKENGRFIIPLEYDSYLNLSDSAAIVRQANTFRVMEYARGTVVQDNISAVLPLGGNPALYAFRRNGKWGVINSFASLVMPIDADTVWRSGNHLYIKQNGKAGVRTLRGRDVILCEYDEISPFMEGYVRVRKGNLYGLVSQKGEIAVPVQYDAAEFVRNQQTILRKNNTYGVWNVQTNKFIIALSQQLIQRNDKYEFYAVTTDGKAYFTGLDGKKLNQEAFDSIYVNDDIARMRVRDKGRFKFYNAQLLRYASELNFEQAQPFVGDFACVKNNGLWGVINVQGVPTLPYSYEEAPVYLSVAGVNKQLLKIKEKGGYGVAEATGKVLLKPQYQEVVPSEQKLFKVKQSNKWGLVRLNAEPVVEPMYAQMSNGQDSPAGTPEFPAIVKKGKKVGLLNAKGEQVFEAEAEALQFLGDGVYGYVSKQKWNLVNAQGKPVEVSGIEEIRPFSEHLAAAKSAGKWGFVTANGKWQVQPQYETVTDFNGKSAYVQTNGKWGAVNRNGKFLLPAEYDGYEVLSNGTRHLIKK